MSRAFGEQLRLFNGGLHADARERLPGLHSFDQKAVSERLSSSDPGESLISPAQQHLALEYDINVIMRRFGATGMAPEMVEGVYGDFTGITDYESAVEAVQRADRRFMELPAEVREKFDNDVGVLIQKAREMGEDQFNREYLAPKGAEEGESPT